MSLNNYNLDVKFLNLVNPGAKIRMPAHDAREMLLRKLFDLSKGKIIPIVRYDVGKELSLPNDETDAIVTELEAAGKIKKIAGIKIMLTSEAKGFLSDR